ncbi:cap-specific mRNA (nucleoside-2'-O-)-methyltransferase 1-like [Uloborus diversus]|uniref:cap-specific mRNA (nucleoside-2'-O-)-methyltransferase 1-like n=1 Tax=Uloborus diversus TaxID=327109 RepID=UPI0024097665|nr:cap-specific mRNA (nucleoside-2'-O-)-methyltransferase 1-like [Uloborus diversus]
MNMLKKFKSLSDSSTSESEDDYGKRGPQKSSSEHWGSATKRSHSTEDAEDDHNGEMMSGAGYFKMPTRYTERNSLDDDNPNFSPKRKKSDDENPSQSSERDSDSEGDDKDAHFKNSNLKGGKDTYNGINYGLGAKLMQKMGFKAGAGLGKNLQGRVDIVEASKQRGRRGLGLHIAGLEPSDTKWDFSKEEISVKEEVNWMPECNEEPLTMNLLRDWMIEGKKKRTLDDETEFCDPEILTSVLQYKSVFDKLEPEEMRKARTKSNPFETIRGGIFLNRAAMKMANMDAVFDFMFTNPKTKYGEPMVQRNELLYFADVCAGPGGFSEYVLWRKKWECKGFGFTLKNANDFKLEDFFAGPPETFEPLYGVTEDGDVFIPENIIDFKKKVFSSTDDKGVHFVMADGGFSVEGNENIQEILSKRLYLCQFLCALSVLRTGGHFVCKLFDLFTPFSVGLVYLMYHAFEKVCIFKPNTSRPANSERYIICKWRKENTKNICDYMYEVNCHIAKRCGEASDVDVREIVPLAVLKEDQAFYDYIVNSNNRLGARQVIHLDKIRAFAQNSELHDERQNDLKKQCLTYWQVPDRARAAPSIPDPEKKFAEIMGGGKTQFLSEEPQMLTKDSLTKLEDVFDFQCVVSGETPSEPATFFLGLGRLNVYRYDVKNSKWKKIEATLELPANTLFYGEFVYELKGENRAQRKILCLHIIDAISIGGKDVRKRHYKDRMIQAEKLVKAVSKPSKKDYTSLRVKTVFDLHLVREVFAKLALKFIKNSQVPRLCFDLDNERHILPTGLLIFRTVVDPWVVAFSKTQQRIYFFNKKDKTSVFERIEGASADFLTSFSKRLFWDWESGAQLLQRQSTEIAKEHSGLHGDIVKHFIEKTFKKLTGQV